MNSKFLFSNQDPDGLSPQSFYWPAATIKLIKDRFLTAKQINLGSDLYIVPMTDDLYDEINNFIVSADIGSLVYMSENMEAAILKIIGNERVGYVEAEYFGGQGGQAGLLWNNGERSKLLNFGQGCINIILRDLGVVVNQGSDEFDTVGLGRHRHLENWIE